jgi:hypothetical protein
MCVIVFITTDELPQMRGECQVIQAQFGDSGDIAGIF